MKYLKLFEDYSDIESICLKYGIENFKIVDGLVNVDGNVYLDNKKLSRLPVKFGNVCEGRQGRIGNFFCNDNNLTTLEGCPKTVDGYFYCHRNKLTSLKGSPERVSGEYYCSNNKLRDFSGIPLGSLNEGQSFWCYANPVEEIYDLFDTPRCIDPLNEYSVIQGSRVIWDRLEEVYYETGLEDEVPDPNDLEFENYELVI